VKINSLIFAVLALCNGAIAQSFENLDFEQSTIVSYGIADVPGWTEYNGWNDVNYSGGMTVIYNNNPLDDSGVSLVGTNYSTPAIQGIYSILLLGGTPFAENSTTGSAIGQTAQIPQNAQSITYWGLSENALTITFDGHLLSFNALNATANYTVFGADISAYAGQTGELLFTAPWQGEPGQSGFEEDGMVDNIQFSSSPIPEPNEFSLVGLGALLLRFRRWHSS
jgi:hypothetical protein